MNRRLFIQSCSAATAAGVATANWAAEKRARPLRLLILGGTQFIGVHMVEIGQQRGHTITLFNRGQTNPGALPGVEKLKGDRDGQLDTLKGRQWDAVIDNSGYVPRHVRLSAELLAPQVQRYLFVSTISTYASFAQPNDENSPVGKLSDESVEKVDGETYGPLKVLCEKAALSTFADRATIVRPGYIVGPHDSTDRFTYWPARAARGGEMLAPGTPKDRVQFIDVRDFARFVLDLVERDKPGTYNVVSQAGRYSMGQLIDASVKSANELVSPKPSPKPTWVSADFLEQHKSASSGGDFPIWHPGKGEMGGFAQVDSSRAIQAGLKITPIETTVRDTLAWQLKRPPEERNQLKAGLSAERERELLAAWKAHGKKHS